MCMSTEEFSNLCSAVQSATTTGNVPEMERVLTEKIDKQVSRDDFSKILHCMITRGLTAAVTYLINSKLISWSDTDKGVICGNVLSEAIQGNYLEIVKLLVPFYEPPSFRRLPSITKKNVEMVKYLLTLPKIKETLCQSDFYYKLLDGAISIGNLEIIEGLLAIKEWNMDWHYGGDPSEWRMDFWQTAANLRHFAIAYCLASKFKSLLGPTFSLKKYKIPPFYLSKCKIKDKKISVDDFLEKYEEEMLSRISTAHEAIENLNFILLPPLTTLILEYFGKFEGIPSQFQYNTDLRSAYEAIEKLNFILLPPLKTLIMEYFVEFEGIPSKLQYNTVRSISSTIACPAPVVMSTQAKECTLQRSPKNLKRGTGFHVKKSGTKSCKWP